MSYLQIVRRFITYADSLDPVQAGLVRIVLSSKRKIIHYRKKEDFQRREMFFWRDVSIWNWFEPWHVISNNVAFWQV